MGTRAKTKPKGRRLLVLACSSRKVPGRGPLPAIERYDGVAFRVVKRLLRLGLFPQDVDVLILSAKYGLIEADHPVQNYDLRMTPELAVEQANRNRNLLGQTVERGAYGEIFLSAGRAYLLALEPFDTWQGSSAVTINLGKIGFQLKALKNWLLQSTRPE